MEISWRQIQEVSICHGTAVPPPWNHWWSDLPVQFVPELVDLIIEKGCIEDSSLRIKDVVEGWPFSMEREDPQLDQPILGDWSRWTELSRHGLVKSSLMTLGIEHLHDDSDILIPKCCSRYKALSVTDI